MTSPKLNQRVRSLEEVRMQNLLKQASDLVTQYSRPDRTILSQRKRTSVLHNLVEVQHRLELAVEAFGGGDG